MNWRKLVSIAIALTYTALLVTIAINYEAWRLSEMDKDPFITLQPFIGTFEGGLMMIIGVILWSAVGIIYLKSKGGHTTIRKMGKMRETSPCCFIAWWKP
ncbi:MAG: hypothetical protein JSV51_03365 [Candidatus Bathyarchaeota archaeon]|nr:MAG: hypothetical protein JSV51_03365 [Candidatus Bathyarchaeota archaeon]